MTFKMTVKNSLKKSILKKYMRAYQITQFFYIFYLLNSYINLIYIYYSF